MGLLHTHVFFKSVPYIPYYSTLTAQLAVPSWILHVPSVPLLHTFYDII